MKIIPTILLILVSISIVSSETVTRIEHPYGIRIYEDVMAACDHTDINCTSIAQGDVLSWNDSLSQFVGIVNTASNTDTQHDTSTRYLYNNTTTKSFNETMLNLTIADWTNNISGAASFEGINETNGSYLLHSVASGTDYIWINESALNATIVALEENDTTIPDTIDIAQGINGTNSSYLYNLSNATANYIILNETALNATIIALEENNTFNDIDTDYSDETVTSTWTFNDPANHEWNPVTEDLTLGDADEGQLTLGTTTIGQADDTISTTVLDDIFIIYNNAPSLAENISFVFFGPSDQPRFIIPEEGADFATYNPRSMVIGPAATLANMDENILCSTNFNVIDCQTGGSGADLGVQDDIEALGAIYAMDWTNVSITESQISDLTHTSDTNTQHSTDMPYLYNDTDSHIFNETMLNLTIAAWTNNISGAAANEGINDTNSSYLYTETLIGTEYILFNDTRLNLTIADWTNNISGAASFEGINETNGTYLLHSVTGGTDYIWLNETLLNATIIALEENDTTIADTIDINAGINDTNGTYLINNTESGTNYIWLNETLLNATIVALEENDTTIPALTEEQVEDYVGSMLTGTETLITVDYQDGGDGTGTIDFIVTSTLSSYTDDLTHTPLFVYSDFFNNTNLNTTGSPVFNELNTSISRSLDWTNVSITESQVSDADWWDADGDIAADEISEGKIAFSTACAAGNHFYLSGNDLACEADADTIFSYSDYFNNTNLNTTGNPDFTSVNITEIELQNGGNMSGNNTCVSIWSPDGTTRLDICN